MARVKICGLTRAADVAAVNKCGADFAGFVFAESRRRVSPDEARQLIEALHPTVTPVGVFVDEDAENVALITKTCKLGAVQLHGTESNVYISALRKLLPCGIKIIKAVRVKDATSLEAAGGLECDLLLLDAYNGSAAGGSGKRFDWNCIVDFDRPYLLAGGLNAGNVADALSRLQPYGVDVSTGVETDGTKDETKIAEFIRLVRGEGR